MSSSTSRMLIVGIDFGTTYSGLAWAETQQPDRRSAITTWPISKTAREGESSEKVPTKLRYHGNDTQWGFSIPVNAPPKEVIEWFKLGLDPSAEYTSNMTATNSKGGRKKQPEELARDFISELGHHLQYVLREKLGAAVLDSIPIRFVVTVPAMWSDQAKEKTRLACLRADGLRATLNNLELISEPEAAATYALHGLDPHGLKVNDTIVIVDAGGGTVDLISYTITQLEPILGVKEAVPGTGGFCGSTYLNERFQDLLRRKLGSQEGFDNELVSDATEAFDKKIKRHYTTETDDDEIFFIPVGGLANNAALGVRKGRYSLKGSDIRDIFAPIIFEIVELVEDQVNACKTPPRAILLVGGFGASTYLKECLRKTVAKDINVMQPPNAWQAIVQGAVMKGLANSDPARLTAVRIKDRKARKHYGTTAHVRYDKDTHEHLSVIPFWSSFYGHRRINLMSWFINRGEIVSENIPISHHFFISPVLSGNCLGRFSVDIYTAEGDQAPQLPDDERLQVLSTISVDLDSLPKSVIKSKTGVDSLVYDILDFETQTVHLSASTEYSFWCQGERYGSVNCEYA